MSASVVPTIRPGSSVDIRVRDATLAYLNYAAERLKAVGFQFVYASMKSEAVYYALPNHLGTLRLSAHRSGGATDFRCSRPIKARLTLNAVGMKPGKLDSMIAMAIGEYLLAHAAQVITPFNS